MHLNSSPAVNAESSSKDSVTAAVDASVEDNADSDLEVYSPNTLTLSPEGVNKMVSQCPIFDGTNYIYWHKRMEFLLRAIDYNL
jgi:hypothetical protein